MAAHRATGRTAGGADRRLVLPSAGIRPETSRVGRHRAVCRAAMPRSPRIVPLVAGLSVAAGIVLLVPTAQAADSQSLRPAAHMQAVASGALLDRAADAQSGTGLVPLSTESASLLAARAFAGDGPRGAVAMRDFTLPVSRSSVPVAPDPANPLAAALLLIFGGGVVFAVSRARTVGGYRGGHHL